MKYLFVFCFIILFNFSYGQTIVTILPDSTIKFFNDIELRSHADKCTEGLSLLLDDSTQNIIVEKHIKRCKLNGVYRRFYENSMIMEMGNYVDDKADGVFYFWDKNGFLKRKEFWKKNKIINTIMYAAPTPVKQSK